MMKKDWPTVERIDMRYKVQINMLQCFDVVFLCTKWIHDLEAKLVNEFMSTFDQMTQVQNWPKRAHT